MAISVGDKKSIDFTRINTRNYDTYFQYPNGSHIDIRCVYDKRTNCPVASASSNIDPNSPRDIYRGFAEYHY
jgi:hypothetical protein